MKFCPYQIIFTNTKLTDINRKNECPGPESKGAIDLSTKWEKITGSILEEMSGTFLQIVTVLTGLWHERQVNDKSLINMNNLYCCYSIINIK